MNYNQDALKELFQTVRRPPAPEQRPVQGQLFYPQIDDGQLVQLSPDVLTDFPADRQPFRPATAERLEELKQDIAANTLLSPLVVRPMEDGTYQILIGHNRRKAAVQLGYTTLPCIVRYLDDEQALQALISDNLLHREKILPSEKAFAYKMRLDCMNRQGQRSDLTSGQHVPKFDGNRAAAQIGEDTGNSYKTVQRYVRLTKLIRPLLDKVDNQEMGLQVGVTLSYLSHSSQRLVLRYFYTERKDGTGRLDQRLAEKLRELDDSGLLNEESLTQLLQKPPGSRAPRIIKVPMKSIRSYFPQGASQEEITEKILFALRTVYGKQR